MKAYHKLFTAVALSGILLSGCSSKTDTQENTTQSTLKGSIFKGPITNATVILKDPNGNTVAQAVSAEGLFELKKDFDLTQPYYVIETKGGSYQDEATKQNVSLGATQGLRTLLSSAELESILQEGSYVAITPETTIYADLVRSLMEGGASLSSAMQEANTTITGALIAGSSPMPGIQGDTFIKKGNLAKALPSATQEAFAKNRAIAYSYLVRDLGKDPQEVIDLIESIAQNLSDGTLDNEDIDGDGVDENISQEYSLARMRLFQDTTTRLREGNLTQNERQELQQMGFDTQRFGGDLTQQRDALSQQLAMYQTANLPTLPLLPTLIDEDGNLTDMQASYTFRAKKDINVTIASPDGNWSTQMWRYNGTSLPVIVRAKRGQAMTLHLYNELDADTTIHWHGFKIPADMDGGPDIPIAPGGHKAYTFTIDQPAAPLWFHPHPDMQTGKQVYMGLAGAFLLEDEISKDLEQTNRLPSGEKDVVLFVQDRRFGEDQNGFRKLLYMNRPMDSDGMYGDTVLVNGTHLPKYEVANVQYRFRLYNVSNARTYDFALSDGSTFKVVATDGGLLPEPVEVDHIMLGAAERVEIIVDFSRYDVGQKVFLVSRPFNGDMMAMMMGDMGGMNGMQSGNGDMGGMNGMQGGNGGMGSMGGGSNTQNPTNPNTTDNNGTSMQTGGMGGMDGMQGMGDMSVNGQAFVVMRFDVVRQENDPITLYDRLPQTAQITTRLSESDATNPVTREFVMSLAPMQAQGDANGSMQGSMGGMEGMQFVINGKLFDPKRVDEYIEANAVEVWSITNRSPMPHPFHAHAIQYQILDRNGVPASGVDLGWKDTFLVQPGETIRVIGKFEPVNQGDYMYHCHILEHEDAGMMGYFRVGPTGQLDSLTP